jgi:hypothetical protein
VWGGDVGEVICSDYVPHAEETSGGFQAKSRL